MPSPFLAVLMDDWIAHNDRAFAIRDPNPVTEGHSLVIPRREFSSWFDATTDERVAIWALVDVVKAILDREFSPHGYNVGINIGSAAGQDVPHMHVHVIPRRTGDLRDGTVLGLPPLTGERDSPRLLTGENAEMRDRLVRCIRATDMDRIDLIVSFILESGLGLVAAALDDALSQGKRIRALTSDYLNVTDAAALGWLLDRQESAPGSIETRVFPAEHNAFHPKAYIFWSTTSGNVEGFVGSSNLSRSGLAGAVEWNLVLAGADQLRIAFERFWADPRCTRLTHDWLRGYRDRTPEAARGQVSQVAPEPVPLPLPHDIQEEALRALDTCRAQGHQSGLVVLATGLGKTYLAAFDTAHHPQFRRVLFVAHREEILRQARDAFRRARPKSDLGLFSGTEKRPDADIVFATIQTLHGHLQSFAPEEFDYLVVDEFHHAWASTYRAVIGYFRPRFLLGLTATPERMDGGDILGLCGENLVYRCDLVEGIRRSRLVPFHYYGVRDTVDFEPIPWRSGRFDPEALTRAVETQERAQHALDEWRDKGQAPTLAFCCSITHADFMAEFFHARGIRAAAVHAGATSAPREQSIEALAGGQLDIIFSIDIFNEGLDVPEIRTVLMLRPTESPVIFLQQLGRGLRLARGKERLVVIDFIGNHRSFLVKPRTLLGLGPRGPASVTTTELLAAIDSGEFELPEGCRVTYDLEVKNMYRQLARMSAGDGLAEFCAFFSEEEGARPTAAEVFRAGFNPTKARSRQSWFEFLRELGQLSSAEGEVLRHAGPFLQSLETDAISKSFKPVTLQAMASLGKLAAGADVAEVARAARGIMARDPRLMRDMDAEAPTAASNEAEWAAYWRRMPMAARVGVPEQESPWLRLEGDTFKIALEVPEPLQATFAAMVSELAEYRLARYLTGKEPLDAGAVRCKLGHRDGHPLVRLDRKRYPAIPQGDCTLVIDGRTYYADFGKNELGSVRELGKHGNVLLSLLRGWFTPSAGLPGTQDYVILERAGTDWTLRPDRADEHAGGDGGTVLPVFSSYKLACGAFGEAEGAARTRMLRRFVGVGDADPNSHFVTFAWGDSMEGGPRSVRHGDMLLMRWLQEFRLQDLVGQVVLVELRSGGGDGSQVLKQLGRSEDGYTLKSANPAFPAIQGTANMRPVATLVRPLLQREFNPLAAHLHQRFDRKGIPPLYGETFNPGNWNAGHISLQGRAVLLATLQKSEEMAQGSHYEDRLASPDTLIWSSQDSTTREGKKGRELLECLESGNEIHIWLRRRKGDGDFVYCGMGVPITSEGEKPIRITWRFYDPLPADAYHGLTRS